MPSKSVGFRRACGNRRNILYRGDCTVHRFHYAGCHQSHFCSRELPSGTLASWQIFPSMRIYRLGMGIADCSRPLLSGGRFSSTNAYELDMLGLWRTYVHSFNLVRSGCQKMV